jgi:plasmid stability protein
MPYWLIGCRWKKWAPCVEFNPISQKRMIVPVARSAFLAESSQSLCAIIAISDIIDCMASITIRRLPENTKRRLRIRAARNGRSMEQEARELLEAALARTEPKFDNLGEIIHRRFAALGGVDLKIPPRGPIRDPGIR